ncbi:hypothetical protein DAT1711_10260 [Enterococcus cecorum]
MIETINTISVVGTNVLIIMMLNFFKINSKIAIPIDIEEKILIIYIHWILFFDTV